MEEAHTHGLKRISTMLIQAPEESNGNVAICSGEVETEKGILSGIGDASPVSVKDSMVNRLIRVAETRAQARALRDAVNVGTVAVEELDEDLNADHEPGHVPMAEKAGPVPIKNGKATEAQIKAIFAIGKSRLGLSDEQLRVRCHHAYRKYPDMLTNGEASE